MLVAERPLTIKWKTSDITTRTVLAVFERPYSERQIPAEFICRLRGCPVKVARQAIKREFLAGYIDIVGEGCLTPDGKSRLDELCASAQEGE